MKGRVMGLGVTAGILGVAVAVALVAGCSSQELPTAPSELLSGIIVYEHANFQGQSAQLTQDVSSLSDYKGPCQHESTSCGMYGCTTSSTYNWEDCVSSIKLAPGWHARIYEDGNFQGKFVLVTADVPDLQLVTGPCKHDSFNDCVSSIRVTPQ